MAEGSCTASPRVDVLHPLACLHSVCIHSMWGRICTKHCVLLQDIVAVLECFDDGDCVHISSTNNLSSWTTTRLPHRYTSLSTYRDQLVAVGGRQISTYGLTNKLLTSSNGCDWQSTLPVMQTRRSLTSSVSGRSPAILVVAGGIGLYGQDLDIVEVLLDNQWSTVARLPKACCKILSTLYAGSIYFTHEFWDTMYTCTCESLCTSRGSETSTSVWMEIKVPHNTVTIASYASRLITIDRECVIRGYNNGHWTKTTVGGDWKYEKTNNMAAAELPTGGLLVACDDGVYTLSLSVDTFDPDGRFISNVLYRLEAVMDIQIVSVLANLHKQLTTSSGVDMPHERRFLRKVPIPNPKKSPYQYVEELMSLWSSGYNRLSLPTWRELLLVLQDVGQQELAQQIETFMKESRVDEDSHDSSEADDVHPDSGFSLADYPPLSKLVDGEKKVLAGFSADNEVSVMYRGERGRLDWEECGLTLLFESSDHSEASMCPVRVSAGESGAFRYPPRVEPASRVYHINCPKQLPAPVTIRIKHNVPEEDIPCLRFITCSEDQPPYDYTILNEGNFTAATAEISLKGFLFCALGKLKNLVKGFLSIRERSYAASLHCSVQPTQSISAYSWKVYVSAVKNCACFRQSIKKYIKEEYEEDVKLEVNQVVSFVDTEKNITAITSCECPLRNDVHMNPCGSPVIKKTDISRYVDAIPPHIRYDLQVPLQLKGASLNIKITLEGLKKPKNYLCLHLTVPHLSSPPPVSLLHKSDRLSSQLESSSHTGSSPLTVSDRSTSVSSPEQEPCARSGSYAFTMKNLRVLHIGPDIKLYLIEEMSSQWKEAGDLLGLRDSHIRAIQENNSRNVIDCCREVMVEWLYNEIGSYNYPPSWEGLCELLKDLKLAKPAQHIENMVLT